MNIKISVKDRETGAIFIESLSISNILYNLYKKPKGFWWGLRHLLAKPFISRIVGWWAHTAASKKHIEPFIQQHAIDPTEFQNTNFTSFSAFFVRQLKATARPLAPPACIVPCDARVLAYDSYNAAKGIVVKGEKFSLNEFLGASYEEPYSNGPLVVLRLAPCDYHRFHAPVDCIPQEPHLINGKLFSVNPFALQADFTIFTQNKRIVIPLETEAFGRVLLVAIGATSVGSIQMTYTPGEQCIKGQELGYFDLGGSSIVLCFLPHRLQLDCDLIETTQIEGIEMRCKLGQSLARHMDAL